MKERSRVREEMPVRKSTRSRQPTFKSQEYATLMQTAGNSIYCEDDRDIEKILYTDETEFLLSVMNDQPKASGIKRKKKLAQKQLKAEEV